MLGKLGGWDDTIVALSTPPGIGAIGVIRLSGTKALDIVNDMFPSKDLASQSTHTLHVGLLKNGNITLDEVVVSIYRNPRSYTGEDVMEISSHGSPYVQEQIINATIERGARLAKPGEFTQRAFLKGKLDLTQAEAVADLIASNTQASHQTALKNIRGGFSENLLELREKLIRFSALIELELDFATEDLEFANRKEFYHLINELTISTQDLMDSFKLGNVIKNGVNVAIVGKPNAGKSTLLNTLLNENRAIVSEIAGTTRDTIEEVLNINGILFRLIDTAGIRDSGDKIEVMGVEKSLEKMRLADIVMYVFDGISETREGLMEAVAKMEEMKQTYLLVGNKMDLSDEKKLNGKFSNEEIIYISAKKHSHISELREKLTGVLVEGQVNTEHTIVTNARHYAALQEVARSLGDIRKGLDAKIPGDLLSLDIRRCLHYLGEITGEITNEDRLDFIFSKFCIGK